MSPRSRRIVFVLVLLLLALVVLLLTRCNRRPSSAEAAPKVGAATGGATSAQAVPAAAIPASTSHETLSPATIGAPAEIGAGTVMRITWTGPDNPGDYVTIVKPDAAPSVYKNYRETKHGPTLEIAAPVEPGDYELRYVTVKSRTILARAPLKVHPVAATLEAPDSAELGSTITIAWTGPNNPGDYVTIVPAGTRDGQHGAYAETSKGSPLRLTLPVTPGDAELRYVTGQGAKVIGRHAIRLTTPDASVSGPDEVVAGSVLAVHWTGPKNPGEFLTIVPKALPDGQHQNYANASEGSPLKLTAPMWTGEGELRYMTATGGRVLARRPITVIPAVVTLDAALDAVAGTRVTITWTGPANRGDYITIVPKGTRDGEYARYADASKGSPLVVEAPGAAGPCEIRYMSGQGAKVLARRTLNVN